MPVQTISSLLEALHQTRLLTPAQLEEITQQLQSTEPEPKALARALLERGWLTPYQVNQLFQGKARELVLGQYILLERLGEGTSGQVFKARHQHMKRMVSLEVVREDLLQRPEAVEQFYQAVQAVSQLSHPNLVAAYDAGPIGRTHFFAMEYVEGIDLERLVQQSGPLRVELACDYLRQTTRGLQHAYEHGLRHPDLTPADILVTQWLGRRDPGATEPAADSAFSIDSTCEALIKVRNLGLTLHRLSADESGAAGRPGKADFLAPERAAAGDEGDIRADLYSLGCIGYFLLTSRVPFPGGTAEQKRQRHQQEEPVQLETARAEVPVEVATIVRQLMAKDPANRYHTPGEVAADLAAVLGLGAMDTDSMPSPTAPTPAPTAVPQTAFTASPRRLLADLAAAPRRRPQQRSVSRRWLLLNLTGGLLLLALGAGIVFLLTRSEPVEPTGPPPPPTPEEQALKEFGPLQARATDPMGDRETLRNDLLAYQRTYAGSRYALRAAALLRDLPSPLDALSAEAIPASERVANQPPGLVAVLGNHRQRNWGPIGSVAYQPDGTLLATGGFDGVIRLWDEATLNEQAALRGHTGRIHSLAFAPDGETLASGSADRTIRLWTVSGQKPRELFVIKDCQGEVLALAFSADGKRLAAGSSDKQFRLWDLTGDKPRLEATVKEHTDAVGAVAFAPDGWTMVTGSLDKTVRVWALRGAMPQERAILKEHAAAIRGVAISPDGKSLATGGYDRAIRLWDLGPTVPKPRGLMKDTPGMVNELVFAPNGRILASVGANDAVVRLWDLTPPENAQPVLLAGHQGPVWSVRFSADGQTLCSGGQDAVLRLWALSVPRPVARPVTGPQGPATVVFSPDGKTVASGNLNDRDVRLWDLTQARPREWLLRDAHPSPVRALAFAPDGQTLACGGTQDPSIRLWTLVGPEARERGWLLGHPGGVHALAYAPDGRVLASAGEDRCVRLWNLTLGEPKERPTSMGHANRVLDVAFAPDGRTLVSAGADGLLKLWDVNSMRELATLFRDNREYDAVAFAPDGKTLAAASMGPVQLWDLTTRKEVLSLVGHPAQVTTVAFSPDGQRLVSAGPDGRLIFWDRANGNKVADWQMPGGVQHIAFAPDSRHLATGNGNGTVYVFRLAPPAR